MKTIQRFIEPSGKKNINYNLKLRISKNGNVSCAGPSDTVRPIRITVTTEDFCVNLTNADERHSASQSIEMSTVQAQNKYPLRSRVAQGVPKMDIQEMDFPKMNVPEQNTCQTQKNYSLRARIDKQIPKQIPKTKTTTVAELGVSVQKRYLWAECKKKANKLKLIENSIVIAKQVQYLFGFCIKNHSDVSLCVCLFSCFAFFVSIV